MTVEAATPASVVVSGLLVRDGIIGIALCLIVPLVVGFVVALVAAARLGLDASRDHMRMAIYQALPVSLLLAEAAAALTLALFLRRLAARLSWPVLTSELGLTLGTAGMNAAAFLSGVALSVALVAALLATPRASVHLDFTLQLLVGSRQGRLAWIVAGALMAGPIEEILFRGLLLASLRSAVSLAVAALASGFAFWLLHMPRVSRIWPTGIFIALLAVWTTTLRLRTRSLGPAVSAHVAYNLVLGILALRAV